MVSLLVPAVVGIAISGEVLCVIGTPFPMGAFTKSRNSASGLDAYRLATLHVSIDEPPPKDMPIKFHSQNKLKI